MSISGIGQNNYYDNTQTVNPGPVIASNPNPKLFNGGTVTIRTILGASQKDVLQAALEAFAYKAGINDPTARRRFADEQISKLGGNDAKLYYGKNSLTPEQFAADKADGKVSVSITPGRHDGIIRDLRNLQVEQGVITFSEAMFTPIKKDAVQGESLIDSVLNSRYKETQIFDPAQMRKQGLHEQYRDNQYQKVSQDPNLKELALDMTQMGLDIVGIFEPTPFADLTNTGISALRGEWGNAALSLIGVVPYVGDLAKLGKIPKWIKSIENISNVIDKLGDVMKAGGKVSELAEGFVREVKRLLDKIPLDKLPAKLQDAFRSLKKKVDDFFGKNKPDIEPPKKPQIAKTPTGQKAVTQNTLEHIFHGEINKKGKAVGFHYEGTGAMQAANKTKTTSVVKPPDSNGVYVAKVEVNGVTKNAPSSFFPKTWTKNDVVNAINEAYINKAHPRVNNPAYFEGRSSSGVLIGGYLKPDGTIATAFPIHGK